MSYVVLNLTTFAFQLLQSSSVEGCVLGDLAYRFHMLITSSYLRPLPLCTPPSNFPDIIVPQCFAWLLIV